MDIRLAEEKDCERCIELDMLIMGTDKRKDLLRRRIKKGALYVASSGDQIVGLITLHPAFLGCLYITLLIVHPDFRRKGIARSLVDKVATHSRDGRMFSSTEEDNGISLKMHEALGFRRSGYIDNLPQPTREIFLFKEVD